VVDGFLKFFNNTQRISVLHFPKKRKPDVTLRMKRLTNVAMKFSSEFARN
jgi:hypothetical protein